MFLRGYRHFLTTAASLQWDEAAVDLASDRAAWQKLAARDRQSVRRLLAGFWVGEELVANELEPFVHAGGDETLAACFRVQAVDEARHARLFDRAAREILRVPGTDVRERRGRLRAELEPAFLDLFEVQLPQISAALARGTARLSGAVTMYHLLLEGIVFTAGQLALLELLDGLPNCAGCGEGSSWSCATSAGTSVLAPPWFTAPASYTPMNSEPRPRPGSPRGAMRSLPRCVTACSHCTSGAWARFEPDQWR